MNNRQNHKLSEIIDNILDDDEELKEISFGHLCVVAGLVPLSIGIMYLFLFEALTPRLMVTVFIPSIATALFWKIFHRKTWFQKKF